MRSQAIVRADRRGDLLRILRLCARVDVLTPIAVGPSVEAALLHGCQVVRNKVGADFVPFVHDRPELARPRLNGESRGVAKTGRVRLVRSRLRIDLPDHGPVFLGVHPALGDVAVGADADIEKAPVRAGGHRLRPVMIDHRGQIRDLRRRPARLGLAVTIVEAHQRILVGDVDGAVDQREAVGRIEVVGEDALHLVGAVAVAVAQQRQPIAALHRTLAEALDEARDQVLGAQRRRVAAGSLGNQNVAIGKDQGLARDLEIRGDGLNLVSLRHLREIVAPIGRPRDLHGGQQAALRFGQVRVGAVLRRLGLAVAGGEGEGQGADQEGERIISPLRHGTRNNRSRLPRGPGAS